MFEAFLKQHGVMITLMSTLWLGLAGLMWTSFSGIRADMRDMRADHALIRSEMREEHSLIRSEMREEHALIRSEMREELGGIRARLDGLDTRFGSLDRRTARIEGHLFGVELPDAASEPVFDGE